MIPIKLHIKNFLSYGSDTQEINFNPYNLICLSGKNGHGKSALLDAMTWAIWGEARKIAGMAKADSGLLRLGQRQMMVIFDFEFNKNKYRVRREFTNAYGKAYAYLEFGIFDSEDKLVSLTDKTIKSTQQKIEIMLGLDYDSFINSAFLRQGGSNEFSKKSPKERKEILCSILGLNKYENLRKLALEKIKLFSNEKDTLLKVCEHIEKELNELNNTLNDLLIINQELIITSENEKSIIKDKETFEQQKNDFINKSQELKILNFQLSKNKDDFLQKKEQLKNIHKLWKETHRKKIALSNYKEIEKKRIQLSKKIDDFQKKLKEKLILKEKFLKAKEDEQKILNEINNNFNLNLHQQQLDFEKLIVYKSSLEEKLKQLNHKKKEYLIEQDKIDNESESMNLKLKNIDENKLISLEKQFEKRKNFYQKFIAQANFLKAELIDLDQKKKLSFDEKNPSCPLCEQNLSASRKKFLKQQLLKKETFFNHRLKRIILIIQKLKEILLNQHEEIKLIKQDIDENKILKLKIEELKNIKKKIIHEIDILNKEILNNEEQLDNFSLKISQSKINIENYIKQEKDIIENDDNYKNIKNILNELNIKISLLSYEQDDYEKAISELEKLESILSFYTNLEEINKIQIQRKHDIAQICISLKKIKHSIIQIEKQINEFKNLNDKEIILKNLEIDLANKLKNITIQKEQLLHKKGSLENQKEKLETLEKNHKDQKKLISKLEENIEEYKAISTALSKDGIQALLIEDAIPEIECEANDILAKLTDNQAQIFIESLKDLKKGGTKETLDIKISDSIGIRPYEMFSGGEAFRIDFALRLSISKLLARRAGTSLQTLIIDEGFGSQDEEGLTNIMESIYNIQNDFAKIIIVSHLPTMKDQFPVHFFVEKSTAGSKIKVIEQG